MSSILLKNIVVAGNLSDILIVDERIASVVPAGEGSEAVPADEVVDCTGKAAAPGFVNMHTHAGMALMRGI